MGDAIVRLAVQLRSRTITYVLIGLAILCLDLLTGTFLQFPILFVMPVALAGWYCASALPAYGLAVALPVGRFCIAEFVEHPSPTPYIVANALIRIAVLVLIAWLVVLAARQARRLEQRVENLVKMCAWTRTVEYQGEWVSFEEYLLRRFKIETTHGMSPEETERQLAELMKAVPESG